MSDLEEKLLAARLELVEAEIARIKTPGPAKQATSLWSSPLIIAIVGAAATAIVGLITNQLQLNASRQLERDRLESSLILKAIEYNPDERLVGLQFLVKAGLVTDRDGKIMGLKEDEIPRVVREGGPRAQPIEYSQALVDSIRKKPGVPYPPDAVPVTAPDGHIIGIVLHDAAATDAAIKLLKTGREGLPGPLTHWAIVSEGAISYVASENQRANHVGRADKGFSNANSIGVTVTGDAFEGSPQLENLIRLVADIADRWNIPTEMIVSHAEVAIPKGRKNELADQASFIRRMVDEVRQKHPAQPQKPVP